ncbi:MAG TPA: GTPase ObgE [Dehalococcoidia bacterium]|nr:GTPase ObgE [Dehalococcoidia bacterium]
MEYGPNGADVVVKVPVGTQVWHDEDLIADVTEHNQEFIVAPGGSGGYGNVKYVSSTNQYPVIAQAGERGEDRELRLELKMLADVGIIGAPNAGKSSLISYLTSAVPKIADYPFTTLEPVLGVAEHRDKTIVMVDIPGLIEGAHKGIGLGHEFLRHVERTRLLIHMVDGAGEDPGSTFRQINDELRLFDENLVEKPQIIAINKADLEEVKILREDIVQSLDIEHTGIHVISAATGEGISKLIDAVLVALEPEKVGNERPFDPVVVQEEDGKDKIISGAAGTDIPEIGSLDMEKEVPVLRPRPKRQGVGIFIENDVFVVDAPGVERIAERIDYEDWTARMQLYRHMQKTGVVRALEEAGIKQGDTVRLGTVEWEWD